MQLTFIEVILPIPTSQTYTYRVPARLHDSLEVGMRVLVPLGKKKTYTGVIIEIHDRLPSYSVKYIYDLLDSYPTVNAIQLKMWEWMAEYYMCHIGEVMNAALPASLKVSSESKIQLNPKVQFDMDELSDGEHIIVGYLKKSGTVNYLDLQAEVGDTIFSDALPALLMKEIVLVFEKQKDKYQPKTIKKVRLNAVYYQDDESLEGLFKTLAKREKQEQILLKYLAEIPDFMEASHHHKGVEVALFKNAQLSESSLKTLIKNNVFEPFEEWVSRFPIVDEVNELPVLSGGQQAAYEQILSSFFEKEQQTCLLHGVTGSGKTEVYLHLINNVVENGGQVLLMMPEIALTTQLVQRIQKVFGNKVGVYHSRFSDNERAELWQSVAQGRVDVVVGVRSSVFLPFYNLGMVIVDEEHEGSYKQVDPAPRYHARDVALVLAGKYHSKVLLGSATPSIESSYLAQNGKYGWVQMTERYGDAQMPTVHFVDLKIERARKKMQGEFSATLVHKIEEKTEQKQQVILLQNRRGYANYLSCDSCGWVGTCVQCDVSMTYHLYNHNLKCHYCGYTESAVNNCPNCHSNNVRVNGVGTEQLEESLKTMLPSLVVQRMDQDTTRRKYAFQQIIDDFENGNIDVLVGTQMVAKGLDFERVTLVGVLDIDRAMYFPDFRANERVFQLLTQVSGRAGRKSFAGEVYIQTASPENQVLQWVAKDDYTSFYNDEINERHAFSYPPFVRLIRVIIKHNDAVVVDKAASQYATTLTQALGKKRVVGPEQPVISKVRNQFIQHILVKIERKPKFSLNKLKAFMLRQQQQLSAQKQFRGLRLYFDVDCM